jgi:hypothetical protein
MQAAVLDIPFSSVPGCCLRYHTRCEARLSKPQQHSNRFATCSAPQLTRAQATSMEVAEQVLRCELLLA